MKYYALFCACFLGSSFLNAYNMFKCENENMSLIFSKRSQTNEAILYVQKNNEPLSFWPVQVIYTEEGTFVGAEGVGAPGISFTIPTDQQYFELKISLGCTYVTMQCTASRY